MSRTVRYGVQVEFTVDNVLDGGPSRADIRRFIRDAITAERRRVLEDHNTRFESLDSVRIKYLHEATSTKKGRTR